MASIKNSSVFRCIKLLNVYQEVINSSFPATCEKALKRFLLDAEKFEESAHLSRLGFRVGFSFGDVFSVCASSETKHLVIHCPWVSNYEVVSASLVDRVVAGLVQQLQERLSYEFIQDIEQLYRDAGSNVGRGLLGLLDD